MAHGARPNAELHLAARRHALVLAAAAASAADATAADAGANDADEEEEDPAFAYGALPPRVEIVHANYIGSVAAKVHMASLPHDARKEHYREPISRAWKHAARNGGSRAEETRFLLNRLDHEGECETETSRDDPSAPRQSPFSEWPE